MPSLYLLSQFPVVCFDSPQQFLHAVFRKRVGGTKIQMLHPRPGHPIRIAKFHTIVLQSKDSKDADYRNQRSRRLRESAEEIEQNHVAYFGAQETEQIKTAQHL